MPQYLTATSVLQQRTWPCRRQRPIACELGAGTGAVSLSLLASGVVEAAVITDIQDMLPHLRANVARNAAAVDAGAAYVRALNWATAAEDAASLGVLHGPPFDLIVGRWVVRDCHGLMCCSCAGYDVRDCCGAGDALLPSR